MDTPRWTNGIPTACIKTASELRPVIDWNDAERYEDIETKVLDKMKTDKRISIKQLSKIFGKSKTSMFRIVDKFNADGKIRGLGSEKSGTWAVIL